MSCYMTTTIVSSPDRNKENNHIREIFKYTNYRLMINNLCVYKIMILYYKR